MKYYHRYRRVVIIMAILLISTVYSLKGQDKIDLGVKFGSNITTRIRDTEGSFKYTPGISFHVGSFIKIPLSEKIGLQPEMLYSSRAFYSKIYIEDFVTFAEPSIDNGEYITLIRDNYLSVPICLNIGLNQKWLLQAGPEFGFLLNTVAKDKSKEDRPMSEDSRFDGNFRMDLGPLLGIMFQPNENWAIQGRCYFGVGELLRKTEVEERFGIKDNWQDLVFQISVAYTLF